MMRWLLLGIISTLLVGISLLSHQLEQAQLTAAQQVIQSAHLQEQANQAQRAQRATLTLRRTDAAIHATSVQRLQRLASLSHEVHHDWARTPLPPVVRRLYTHAAFTHARDVVVSSRVALSASRESSHHQR